MHRTSLDTSDKATKLETLNWQCLTLKTSWPMFPTVQLTDSPRPTTEARSRSTWDVGLHHFESDSNQLLSDQSLCWYFCVLLL